jgi:hypothetical protein
VVSVTVSPQLAYISPEAALALVPQVGRLLQKSAWKMSKRYLSDAQARAQLEDASHDGYVTLGVEDWSRGNDEVCREISRQWRKEDSLPKAAGKNYDFCVAALCQLQHRQQVFGDGRIHTPPIGRGPPAVFLALCHASQKFATPCTSSRKL